MKFIKISIRLLIITIISAMMIFPPMYYPAEVFAQNIVQEPGQPISGGSSFSQSKFIPDISFIADFSIVGRNISDDKMKELGTPGFKNDKTAAASPLYESGQDLNANRGFNLNYGELALSSTVDPYFDLSAILVVSKNGIDPEEVYFSTRRFPLGLQMRLGKFKSAFGRINEQHEHIWDFADQPRVYNMFFGQEGLNEEGVRLNWLAPTGFYLLIGAELLQGDNPASFGRNAFHDVNENVSIKGSGNYPNLYTGYIKTSFDFNDMIILMGISNAYGKTRRNQGLDTPASAGSAMYTNTNITGADITVKYLLDSYRYISLQTEYLYRYMYGKGYDKDAGDILTAYDLKKKQSGLYSQMLVRFAQRWRAGIRYELLQQNGTYRDGLKDSAPPNLPKYSAMFDFNPTEFSRIRVQYNYDRTGYLPDSNGSPLKVNHEVILQFNMAIGAHGAHSF